MAEKIPPLFHGTTERRFFQDYDHNPNVLQNWTTGSMVGFSYAWTYALNPGEKILILTYTDPPPDHFQLLNTEMTTYLPGLSDDTPAFHYKRIIQPFGTVDERNFRVERYGIDSIEKFISLYVTREAVMRCVRKLWKK